ncbi:hypothetical protein TNCV_3342021 [Trichonephila clavipes]|nr:hypothetical protein TNCV_3342021 [Trichonephila clavipes]
MLKHLRFDIFERQETKLLVRLINGDQLKDTGHKITALKVKGDIEDVPVNWTMRVESCTSWMKCREFYCSQRVRHLIKPVQGLGPP